MQITHKSLECLSRHSPRCQQTCYQATSPDHWSRAYSSRILTKSPTHIDGITSNNDTCRQQQQMHTAGSAHIPGLASCPDCSTALCQSTNSKAPVQQQGAGGYIYARMQSWSGLQALGVAVDIRITDTWLQAQRLTRVLPEPSSTGIFFSTAVAHTTVPGMGM